MQNQDLSPTANRISLAFGTTLAVGSATVALALLVGSGNNPAIWSAANFLGGLGNDLFLIAANLLIIIWAVRKRLGSIVRMTLLLDFAVWVIVQGIKLISWGSWTLRPNGGAGGFPSGHATHGFAMAFLLTLIFPRFSWLWYSCAVAISWSRIETAWHSGSQVAAGVIIGIALAWIMITAWRKNPEAAAAFAAEKNSGREAPAKRAYVAEYRKRYADNS